ncbi:hypothetical protein TIFTF001_018764 [Ficus carica]|uniref:Ubiquitin-like protease family profile domain-containing protein n=1 Tax=Ficus carica TaxID=3494 RepID=A0AA88AS87_FICCA|nr:hypothetical protein TIFTF001_018764 [Ficus carica]
MSTPTKMSEKNTTPERRSVRVTAKSSKRSSADKSSKSPVPAIERMVSDAGLKRKHGEMDVKDSKKLISSVEDKISKAEEVFHNIVMRLTDHKGMGDALWFELGEDLGRFSINEFCLITGMKCVGSTHLPVVESQLISRYFSTLRGVLRENLELQMSNAKFDNDDDAVKLSLLYIIFCIPLSNTSSATRAAICNTVENRMSSKRIPLKKNDKVHYSIPGFPHALLVWAYETLPSIASKFTTKYDQAIPCMMSWTTADNVKFDDVLAAFTTIDESQLKCFALIPTEEEIKNPWVARLYLKNPKDVPQLPPPKSSVPRPSTDTNFEWWEFQKEIQGQVASLNKKLKDLKKELKNSNKLLRRVLKMLSANMIEKGQGKAQTALHVSSSQDINVQRTESDALKTTSPDIGAVVDMGVQAAMEFLTADKVIISHKNAENEKNKEDIIHQQQGDEGEVKVKEERMRDPGNEKEEEKDGKEIIFEQDVIKLEEPGNEESGDVIPKKKRARLSRLGQRPARPMAEVGSPSKAPSKLPYALPPGLADEPPKKKLEDFRECKWPPRYNAEYDSLDKPYDLGFMAVDKKSLYYELATSPVWLWDEWFADLKHWALVKLELTNWTIEVYDSLQHEGSHNVKIREGVKCMSKFIPLLVEKLSLFEFKPREPPGFYPIPVTIMKDIPQQANGGDCGIFTIKNAECLIEGRDTRLQKLVYTTENTRLFL